MSSCTNASLPTNDQPEIQNRRSANYKQNIWNYNQLQSLTNQFAEDKYDKQGNELKEVIGGVLVQSSDALTRLELIDSIGKLGLATLFEEDIKEALKKIEVMKNHDSIKDDLYATSLCFRLLRQHGFNVSQDLFLAFLNDEREFRRTLYLNVKGMIELLEASHFGFDGENVLDEAKTFATNALRGSMSSSISNDKLRKRIVQALELPLHWSVEWYNAKRNINLLEHEDQTNHSLLKLAKLNFNMVQATHQNELREVSRWWHSIGTKESMGFARDRIVESYLTGVGVGFEPKYGNFRKWLAKAVKLVLVIDDVYDIYGSLQELEVFTGAVERWNKDGTENLPQCMKICFEILYDTTNDLAFEIQQEKGLSSPLLHLQKVWVDFCKALLVEAKWYNKSYVPTFEEYLKNAWISSSGPILSLHALLFLENQVDEELSTFLDKTKDLVYYTSLIIRLCNDQGTSAAELERGDSPSSIACFMRENNVTEKEARYHIENLVISSWKVINKMGFDESPTFQEFFKSTTNMARVAQFLYHKGDGFGVQDCEIKDQILALLIEPLA